jgi:hypothetical protein
VRTNMYEFVLYFNIQPYGTVVYKVNLPYLISSMIELQCIILYSKSPAPRPTNKIMMV